MSSGQDAETVESMRLIRRAQGGDLEAYEEFFARYYARIHRVARRRLGSSLRREVESRDVVHEAVIEAIRAFDHFELRDKPALVAWLGKIVEHRILALRRRSLAGKRDRALERLEHAVTSGRIALEPVDDAPQPEDQIAEREEIELLQASMLELDENQRATILLRENEGLSWEEVAQATGSPSAAAARMVFARAKVALRRALERREPDR